jgi:hypothetical protein
VQRASVIGEIFGYLVCLLAVVIFFMSVAGIVNNAFRVVNPTAGPRVFGARMIGGPGRRGGPGNFFFRTRGGEQRSGPMAAPPAPFPLPSGAPDIVAMRANITADARFDAVRRLVLAIVMLIVSILVFRRAFAWVTTKQATGGGT